VNLEIKSGEIVGLMGPNGSGKTTLAKALAGLIRPKRGSIRKNGKIAYVPQAPDLAFVGITYRDEAKMLGIEIGELGEIVDEPIYKLNRGLRRLLSLYSVLSLRYGVIILDEPANDLDDYYTQKVGEVLEEAAKAGAAILLISHELDLINKISNKIYEIDNGQIREI